MDTSTTLNIIVSVIALEVLAVALLLITIFVTQARKSGGRAQQRRALWESMLPGALAGERHAMMRIRSSLRRPSHWKQFQAFVDEQLRHEQNGSMLGLRRLCRHVGLTERLQRQLLRAHDPLERAAAGRTLARLRERIAEEKILPLLRSKDPAVVLAAAYATASFRDPGRFLPVFRAVYDRTPITLHGAAELLSGFGEGVCPVIHRLLEGVAEQYEPTVTALDIQPADPEKAVSRNDTAVQVVMADLLTFYAYRPAAPVLVQMVSLTDDEEVLIHLVKAVAALGDTSAAPRLTELLGHPSWVVRRQSVQALAAIGAVETVQPIRALLGDDNLMVRTSVLEALAALKSAESVGKVNDKVMVEALA
jgi:hypothetical protein